MRIICFQDEHGHVQWGDDRGDGSAVVLAGSPYGWLQPTDQAVGISRILAPLRPPLVLAIGRNYKAHAAETGSEPPEHPVLFYKNPGAVIGTGDPIRIPAHCIDPPQVDYEVELAVVLGSTARDVTPEKALDHVLGYTIGNDVSARRWQRKLGQWSYAKSFDTFCPLGPCIVTRDEIPDPQALRLTTRIDGELMQDATTADMIFPVAELISFLSRGTTLLPGTVILTGTPEGVGFARNPPVWLMPGMEVEMEIEGIGVLRNPVLGPHHTKPQPGCGCGCHGPAVVAEPPAEKAPGEKASAKPKPRGRGKRKGA
jgi:2-keto-4-pentenoate hydratase/2-oxohepta-3-ene-1,7-dioic acid hydratase in catechol pathway